MTNKEIVDNIITDDISPAEVWEYYYRDKSEEIRFDIDCRLLAVVMTEQREGREWGEVCSLAGNAYDYLSRHRTAVSDDEQDTQKVKEHQPDHETPQHDNQKEVEHDIGDEHDITLRLMFGKHLNDFMKEAKTCKNGTKVAELVNWYITEYDLDKKHDIQNKTLHDALKAKDIIKIGVNGWNKAIK